MASLTPDLQGVLDRTVEYVTKTLPADGGCSVILWDRDLKKFVRSASTVREQQDKQLAANRVRKSGGATRWIIDNRRPVIVPDIRDDPFGANTMLEEFSIQAYIGVPLIVDENVEGVLYAMSMNVQNYQEEDITLLENSADVISLTIAKSRNVEELKQLNNALELYVRTVTHDIKSPMSLALGYLNLVNTEYNELGNDIRQEYLQSAEQMLTKSFSIIDELLLLTEIRSGHRVAFSPVNMSLIVAEVDKRVRPLLENTNAIFDVPQYWGSQVVGYGAWIEEVWVNFISNAIKYGGTPPQIHLGYRQEGDYVCFWVRDNGKGLTQDQQNTLFEPFTRFEATRIQGHGLGLSIVRHIIERMDGTVGVISAVGEGSEFYFKLPISPD